MSIFRKSELFDPRTRETALVDRFGGLRIATPKRLIGSNFGSSIDTEYLYTKVENNGATVTAENGTATLSTNTTANGNCSLTSKANARYLSGRQNLLRMDSRCGDTGVANNVREWGLYANANNYIVYRLSGTTFSIVVARAGVETVVNSGSFNGNGLDSGGTFVMDTNFHSYEIHYTATRIEFIVDDVALHTVTAGTTSIVASLVCQIYASNTNSGGSTTDADLEFLAVAIASMGDAVNNPLFYNIDAVAETRTLKTGGGTIHAVTIGRLGSANALLTLYDNTAGSGTKIAALDLTNNNAFGTHNIGVEGTNFYNGLTYVTSGTMTNGSVTIFWE